MLHPDTELTPITHGRSVAFHTLGCRLNQYETDALASKFNENGYRVVDFDQQADVYVLNTCTVTNQSDRKSRNYINNATRKANNSVVLVTGCMATQYQEELEQRADIRYVVDNERKSHIFSIIDAHFKGEVLQTSELSKDLFGFAPADETFHTRSMIKIQDGCDNFCTFCIVPFVRGRAVSRPVNEILDNIRQVLDFGYREIVITGVNIGRYKHEDYNFDQLIEKIVELPGDFRVRISSIEPDGFGDRFFDLLQHPKLTPHLHLCLQSGSEKILLQMRRMYTLRSYLEMVERIRSKQPDFNFTSDIIVGFPNETDDDFEQTCNIIRQVGFSHIHTFSYSKRNGTRAARMPQQVNEQLKKQRNQVLHQITEENKLQYRQRFINKTQRVLVERVNKNGMASGYGEHYVPVQFAATNISKNTFVNTAITSIDMQNDYMLQGTVL